MLGASEFHVAVCSLKGAGRQINQDSHAYKDGMAYAVADGVGGGAWGEIASALLVGHLMAPEQISEQCIELVFVKADQTISDKLKHLGPELGATVGIGMWPCDSTGDQWLTAWVGDCRLMHMQFNSGGWLTKWISKDQSYVNLSIVPPQGIDANSPANMVGCGMRLPPSKQRLTWSFGDRMVLASDGFWNCVDSAYIEEAMNHNASHFSMDLAQKLCQAAQMRGSLDDITVMLIERRKP